MDGGAWWVVVHGVAKSRTRLSNFTFMHWRWKWQPTPVFLPGESQEQGSLVGCRLWGAQSRTRLTGLSSRIPLGRSLKHPKVIGDSGSLGQLEWKKSQLWFKISYFGKFYRAYNHVNILLGPHSGL